MEEIIFIILAKKLEAPVAQPGPSILGSPSGGGSIFRCSSPATRKFSIIQL
jgi:hypothetical protein